MATGKSDIGLIGLGVMGQNLALNIAEKGFRISVYNRSESKVDETLKRAAEEKVWLSTAVSALESKAFPRRSLSAWWASRTWPRMRSCVRALWVRVEGMLVMPGSWRALRSLEQ